MFDKKMLEQLMKQGAGSQMKQMEDAIKMMQGMSGMPGMEDALKQMKDAQSMIESQMKQAMEQQGNAEAPSKPAPALSKGSVCQGVDIQFKQITSGEIIKWTDALHVEFGSYPQEAAGGVKKILWRVLEKKDGQLLLMSEYLLEYRTWHTWTDKEKSMHPNTGKKEDMLKAMIPWEVCNLRKWLNGYFYENAFHSEEKKAIVERLNTGNGVYMHHDYVAKKMHKMNINALTTETYEKYEERGCLDTKDNVFLLNVKEAIDYFDKGYTVPGTVWAVNKERFAKPTDYMLKRGFYYENDNRLHPITMRENFLWKGDKKTTFPELDGNSHYWLRNAGANDVSLNSAKSPFHCGQLSFVSDLGTILAGGWSPVTLNCGVRPCLLIRS